MKVGRFNDVAKTMVSELFRAEDEAAFFESQTTTISVKCTTSTAAMLTVLSDLFGQSRYAFTGEILDDFTADLFFNLPDNKRAEIATKADEIETEILAKQGVTVESMGVAGAVKGCQTWRSFEASRKYYPMGEIE